MDKYIKERPLKADSHRPLQKMARLAQENQELKHELQQVTSKLELLQKRIRNLNHDLRSPLFGITGMLKMLIIIDKKQVEVQCDDLHMIKDAAQSILDLLNGALEAKDAQISLNGNKKSEKTLSSAMMEINRLYLPMARNKHVSLNLKTEIDKEIHLTPEFFINLIQITGNLVANAIKFTTTGGSVDVLFNLDDDNSQSVLSMSVADTGKCMSADQVFAFNEGEKVSRSEGTNGEKGYGIGLQHVIDMVNEDHGQITVMSKKGIGTTFSLAFPLPGRNLARKNISHFILEDGVVSHNGHNQYGNDS